VRTGTAGYRIDVIGGAEDGDYHNIINFAGQGSFFVDFAAGQFRAKVPVNYREDYTLAGRAPAQPIGDLTMNGSLSATSNGFSGTATLTGLGTNYTGTSLGQFYGPTGQEAGGVFSLTDGSSGVANGAFAGVKDASITDPTATVPTLAQLTAKTPLAFGRVEPFTGQGQPVVNGVAYQPSPSAFEVTMAGTPPFAGGTMTFGAVTRDAVQTLTGYDAHTTTLAADNYKAILLRPDNPIVALSYMSLGEFILTRGPNETFWFRNFSYYGNATSSTQIPRTGTASYSGLAFAYANIGNIAGTATSVPETGIYNVTGRSSLSVDWAAQTFSANITNLVGDRIRWDPSVTPLTYNFNSIAYTGSLSGQTFAATGFNGHSLNGQFFGSNAAEFGAIFIERGNGANQPTIDITGVIAGKKN
jgi:hypothetical protein